MSMSRCVSVCNTSVYSRICVCVCVFLASTNKVPHGPVCLGVCLYNTSVYSKCVFCCSDGYVIFSALLIAFL